MRENSIDFYIASIMKKVKHKKPTTRPLKFATPTNKPFFFLAVSLQRSANWKLSTKPDFKHYIPYHNTNI
jgi:hypothetical protein